MKIIGSFVFIGTVKTFATCKPIFVICVDINSNCIGTGSRLLLVILFISFVD